MWPHVDGIVACCLAAPDAWLAGRSLELYSYQEARTPARTAGWSWRLMLLMADRGRAVRQRGGGCTGWCHSWCQ